jgi:hypothetical protein
VGGPASTGPRLTRYGARWEHTGRRRARSRSADTRSSFHSSLQSSRDLGSSFNSDDLEPTTSVDESAEAEAATAALHAALADPLRPRAERPKEATTHTYTHGGGGRKEEEEEGTASLDSSSSFSATTTNPSLDDSVASSPRQRPKRTTSRPLSAGKSGRSVNVNSSSSYRQQRERAVVGSPPDSAQLSPSMQRALAAETAAAAEAVRHSPRDSLCILVRLLLFTWIAPRRTKAGLQTRRAVGRAVENEVPQ